MFPEAFVERQVRAHTLPGDFTFDPFCGRGTTVFQSLLMGRPSAGTDVNSVAACVAGAKSDPPSLQELLTRIDELEGSRTTVTAEEERSSEFFAACFHPNTLNAVLYLRSALQWRENRVDRFIAAMALGALHGEAHKSELYFSNRMPRTISTKPDYSIRWWKARNCTAPDRDAFAILRRLARFRYQSEPADLRAAVAQRDAREAAEAFPDLKGRVRLVVTSPPYLDTTDYSEDQWLRLWFLGGAPYPVLRQGKDDRLTKPQDYWQFMTEAWSGVAPLLNSEAVIVVRIGGKNLTRPELLEGLLSSLRTGMSNEEITSLNDGITTAIKPRETTVFRPTQVATSRVEHDFTFKVQRCTTTH